MTETRVGAQQEGPRLLTVAAVRAVALRNLGLIPSGSGEGTSARSHGDVNPLSFRAECLRAALWASSNGGNLPVYITRLVGVAEPLLRPDPDVGQGKNTKRGEVPEAREVIRETLEEMEVIGDVTRLPGGFWLPSPLHVVPLRGIGRYLLVGGRPTWALTKDLASQLEFNGVTRFTVGAIEGLLTEKEESWCRLPNGAVDQWAATVIKEAELQGFDDPEIEFEYYAAGVPGVLGSSSPIQYRRWTPRVVSLPEGRYLARQKLFRRGTHHAIVEVRKGKTIASGAIEPQDGNVRRLMYGIDLLHGCPVSVRMERTAESARFVLSNEVPKPELRLLTALGSLELPAEGKYYPRIWTCATRYAPQVDRALLRLGVHLEEGRKGPRSKAGS